MAAIVNSAKERIKKSSSTVATTSTRIAIEGCCHGELDLVELQKHVSYTVAQDPFHTFEKEKLISNLTFPIYH